MKRQLVATVGAVVFVLTGAACTHDLELPAPPGPRSLSGRVIIEEPGTGRRLPADGVFVEMLRSNLSVRTNSDGRFTVGPLLDLDGTLSLRIDADGDGKFERQRLIPLSQLAAGGHTDIAAGELSLGENAFIRGSARLADASGATGQAGTVVFVPGSPFSTSSSDTGAFLLRDLPSGLLSVAAYREGYTAAAASGLTLQPGQVLDVSDLVLAAAPASAAVALTGSVRRTDGVSSAGTQITVLKAGGNLSTATDQLASTSAAEDGTYQLASVAAGLHDVVISADGLSTATVFNVLFSAGQPLDLGVVTLAPGQMTGSGPGAPTDGGTSVNNQPPTAVAKSFVVAAGAVAVLDGSSSSDPEGGALLFDWVQTAGDPVLLDINHSTLARQPHFAAPARGQTISFDLHVTDTSGATATVSCTVTVDVRPVAVAPHTVIAMPGTSVTLDGTSSYDPDNGGPLTFLWTIDALADGGATPALTGATTAMPSLAVPNVSNQLYTVNLVVNDGYVDSLPVSTEIYASAQNLPPIANAGPDLALDQGATALLDPRASADPNGLQGATYAWTAVGSPCGTIGAPDGLGISLFHAFLGDCDGDVQLRVQDSTGLFSTDVMHVQVRDQLPPQVTQVSPASGASGAAAFGPVRFTFARSISAASVDGGIAVTGPDGGLVKGTTRYDDQARTLAFVPVLPFEPGVTFNAFVNPQSVAGLASPDGGFSLSFQARLPTLQAGVSALTTTTYTTLSVAAQGQDYWVGARPYNANYNQQLYRWTKGTLNATGLGVGYGYQAIVDEVRPVLKVAGSFVWYGLSFDDVGTGGALGVRANPHLTDNGQDKVTLNTNGPANRSANFLYGASSVDGRASMLVSTIVTAPLPDAGPNGRVVRLWRNPLATSYTSNFNVPAVDWEEALPPLSSASSPATLTWLAIAANGDLSALVWCDDTISAQHRLHGAVYDWQAHSWSPLPGANAAGEINGTGSATRPSLEYLGGDLVLAYYHTESSATDVRVLRLAAGGTSWDQLGAAISPTTPDLERIELATLGETIWVGWATPPGINAHLPHVMWWDPRNSTWNVPLGAGAAGLIPLPNAGCVSTRPGLGVTADGAGMALLYSPICTPSAGNGLLLQEIR